MRAILPRQSFGPVRSFAPSFARSLARSLALCLASGLALPLAAGAGTLPDPAACPTAADLAGAGIDLIRHQPQLAATYRIEEGLLVEYKAPAPGADTPPSRSSYAHPLAVTARQGCGADFSLAYDADTAALDRLPQTGSWRAALTLGVDGETRGTGTIAYTYRGPGKVTVGGCTYPVWQVEEHIEIGPMRSEFLKEFAPGLGLVLRATVRDPASGMAISQVAFDDIVPRDRATQN